MTSCVIRDSVEIEEYRPAEIGRLEETYFSYSFSPEHSKTFRVVRCKNCTHMFCAQLLEQLVESGHDDVDEEYLSTWNRCGRRPSRRSTRSAGKFQAADCSALTEVLFPARQRRAVTNFRDSMDHVSEVGCVLAAKQQPN